MDIPAAHSMDTTWFAVDLAGEVALLDTYEAGALPTEWDTPEGLPPVRALIAAGVAMQPTGLERLFAADPQGRRSAFAASTIEQLPQDDQERSGILQLAHPRALDLIRRARRLPSEDGVYVFTHSVTPAELTRLFARGLVLRAHVGLWGVPAHLFGLYEYHHGPAWENWTCGPYDRGAAPERPLKVADLPTPVRTSAVSLPIRFAEVEQFQPMEHVDCVSWDETWVGTDGRWRDRDGQLVEDPDV